MRDEMKQTEEQETRMQQMNISDAKNSRHVEECQQLTRSSYLEKKNNNVDQSSNMNDEKDKTTK